MIQKTYIDFLTNSKISANQFLVLWCLTNSEKEILEKYLNIVKLKVEEIDDLVVKGYLLHEGSKPYTMKNIYPTLEFQELLLTDTEECAMQIWHSWYKQMTFNGKKYPARNIDVDEFIITYAKIIKGNYLEHLRILNITKRYVAANPECEFGLQKYIGTRYWDSIEDEFGLNVKQFSFIKDV